MGAGLHGGFGATRGGRSGYKIHKGLQDKHIVGTNNCKQEIRHNNHPSILTEDPERLLREGAGTGQPRGNDREVVDFGRVIGKFFDIKNHQYYETTRGTIHYDQKGNAHIVPARPNGHR